MPKLEPSPELTFPPTLADLSRNASVISTSSSDSGSPHIVTTPKARPLRTFTSPRSRSPRSPSGVRASSKPPAYLNKEFGLMDDPAEVEAATARARSGSRKPQGLPSVRDFAFAATLGEGSYSEVKRATYLRTGQEFAVKVLDKAFLKRKGKMSTALDEKNALVRLSSGHPGIVRLHHAFHDQYQLYFVIDLVPNGEMQTLLSRIGSLSITCARYYSAQIVDALAFMHAKNVVHRDLKPENLLLDENFRIKICDFGTAKILEPGAEPDQTFVGTAQYVSPEMIQKNETSFSVDFWALGCIIYQMIAGRFAFQGLSAYITMEKIKKVEYAFPEGFDEEAKDLVQKLLVREPTERLGAGAPGTPYDMHALRSHPFFSVIEWETLWNGSVPRLQPGLLQKDHPLAKGSDRNWEDIISTWDDMTNGDDDDEINWASDADRHGPLFSRQNGFNQPNGYNTVPIPVVDIGPLGEIAHYSDARAENVAGVSPLEHESVREEVAEARLGQSAEQDGDSPPGTPSTASDGATEERLGLAMNSLGLYSEPSSSIPPEQADDERGRSTLPTPLEFNDPIKSTDILPLLQEEERIIFRSLVESRSLRRRASKLIARSVTAFKPKTRHLVLTTKRLLCIKQRRKHGDTLHVKYELSLKPSEKSKERGKDIRGYVMSVASKGGREFVVLTSMKSQSFAAEDATTARLWIEKIEQAVEMYKSNLPSQART
ncbi:hypothetical protein CCMSSC00406_0002488 [Pleurotus cornucopiae]|uniref:Uncharacterized protein n=1 Tax=Pleurotus cornucopiae TaxID=5321 RepID=A0ACB7IRL5_PLECO|nr:hypothetical protein CCMSSC00406_0002488 [Pleurotus cornucopiae]